MADSVLLAKSWEGQDPTGWWMSEKLDGVRAIWDGKSCLWSRQRNSFPAPKWFTDMLPKNTWLDGELWIARGEFQKTVSVVKCGSQDKGWKRLVYCVFDMPGSKLKFEERQSALRALILGSEETKNSQVRVVPQLLCKSLKHMEDLLEKVLSLGAEGLMLRQPGSLYEPRRSSSLLKVKRFFDEEAEIIAHEEGLGRNKNRLGALRCKDKNGTEFGVGTGLSDAQRDKPPKVGSKITFRFQERSKDGVPRFPSFVCVRDYE